METTPEPSPRESSRRERVELGSVFTKEKLETKAFTSEKRKRTAPGGNAPRAFTRRKLEEGKARAGLSFYGELEGKLLPA